MKTKKIENYLSNMIFMSLLFLAIGLLTSPTVLAVSHILIIIPALYFLNKTNWKNLPMSAWGLLAMIIAITLSVVFNQDVSTNGYKAILKAKYFLIGLLSIVPLQWYFKNKIDERKLKQLRFAFYLATTAATSAGLCRVLIGYNPLTGKSGDIGTRDGGVFGMVMNYSHNMSYFLILVIGIYLYKKSSLDKKELNWLRLVLLINSLGLYFAYTRGAWIAVIIGLAVYCYFISRKFLVGLGILGLILGTTIYYFAGDKIMRPQSDSERLSQWSAAYHGFKERPILGYGYLNFEHNAIEIKKRNNISNIDFGGHAHNNFLEMLASAGIVGFVSFVVWLVAWIIEARKENKFENVLTLAFITTFIAGGMTQATIALGINLFFIMAAYSVLTAITGKEKFYIE